MTRIQIFKFLSAVKLMTVFAAGANILHISSEAGQIQVSFLQSAESLQDTTRILASNGCDSANIKLFEKAVHNYYKEPFDFDFSKFPKPVKGLYSFTSTQELVSSLPHHLGVTRHSFDFNCMDMVIVTAGNRLETRLQPDEIFGPFMISTPTTNGEVMSLSATPRDAFTTGYVTDYREATEAFIPKPMQERRICLTACLYRLYMLPVSTTEPTLETEVLKVLRSNWQRESIRFPSRFEVVLVHGVDMRDHIIATSHAGLLFRRKKGYTYLEKAGGSGPFVRIDLGDKSDLIPWLSAAFLNSPDDTSRRFATFNADSIANLISR